MWQVFTQDYCGINREVIEEYVRNCTSCARYEPFKKTDVVKNVIAQRNWEHVQIDLIDVRKFANQNENNSWILQVIDIYSRCSFAFPMHNKNSIEVI